jgi:hypothetical protein
MPQQNPGAPAKKTSPLVWILGTIVVLMFVAMLTCGVVGFLAVRAVKNAGFDPDLMKRNPGLAMAKMAATLHPDLEVVSTNERTGRITMREKSTGKIVTFKFDPDQKTLVMTGDDGKDVTVTASSPGSVTMKSSDSTVTFGANAGDKAPSWVPTYPGSSPEGTFSSQGPQGTQNTFTFKTKDEVSKVLQFYQDSLKSGGFNVTQAISSAAGGMVSAEDADKKRTAVITIGSSNGETQVSVMAVEKQ